MIKRIFIVWIVFYNLASYAEIHLDKYGNEDIKGQPLSYWIKNINDYSHGRMSGCKNGKWIVKDSRDFHCFREDADKALIRWELQKKLKKVLYFPSNNTFNTKTFPKLKIESKFAYEDNDPIFFDLIEKIFFVTDEYLPKKRYPYNYSEVKKTVQKKKDLIKLRQNTLLAIEKLKQKKYRRDAKKIIIDIGLKAIPDLKKAIFTETQEIKLVIAELIITISPGDQDAVEIIKTELLPKGVNEETLPYLTLLPDLKYLTKALKYPKWNQQQINNNARLAIYNAYKIHKEKILPIITKHLLDPEIPFFSTKKVAISLFESFGENSVPYLIKLLKSENKNIRGYAIRILAKLEDKSDPAIPALWQLLKIKENKRAILRCIATISGDSPKTIDYIIDNNLLNDNDIIDYFLSLVDKQDQISNKTKTVMLKLFDKKNAVRNLKILKIAEKNENYVKKFLPIVKSELNEGGYYNRNLDSFASWYLRVSKNMDETVQLFLPCFGSPTPVLRLIKTYSQITGNGDQALIKYYEIENKYLKQSFNANRIEHIRQMMRHKLPMLLTVENNFNEKNRMKLLMSGFKWGYNGALHSQNYPLLIKLTEHKDRNIRELALKRLFLEKPDFQRIDVKTVDIYIDCLFKQLQVNRNVHSRIKAIGKLSAIKDKDGRKKVIEILFRTLEDPMDKVAATAVKALNKQGTLAMPQLLDAIKNKSPYFGITACRVIAGMSLFGRAAVPTLEDILKTEKNIGLRLAAIDALGELGPPAKRTIPLLKKELDNPDKEFRIKAARALILLGGIPNGDQALLKILNSGIISKDSEFYLGFANLILEGIE